MNIKKLFIIVLLFLFSSFLITSQAKAGTLNGWAWSDNTGWISFNSTDSGAGGGPYSVIMATTSATAGTFSGYGWSDHIGWVSFNLTSGCPNGSCTPSIDLGTGAMSGWIRACAGTVNGDCASASRTDGWDGWIELAGVNHPTVTGLLNSASTSPAGVSYNKTSGEVSGYAWGSDVVGWVQFKNATCNGCGSAGIINPVPWIKADGQYNTASVLFGSTTAITWGITSGYADVCTIDNGISTLNATSGSRTSGAINATTTFNIKCTNLTGGSGNSSVVVGITVPVIVNPPPVGSTGKLWIGTDQNLKFKQIRPNQPIGVTWNIGNGWSNCQAKNLINSNTFPNWTDAKVNAVNSDGNRYASTTLSFAAGSYSLQIWCPTLASSTNPIQFQVKGAAWTEK